MSEATRVLAVQVLLHDGRFHGSAEYPPGPARLFQALLAGAANGANVPGNAAAALRWLEGLPAPTIAAPAAVSGQRVKFYVPNNDLDAKGANPTEVANLRVGKTTQPRLLECSAPFYYIWPLDEPEAHAEPAAGVCQLANQLYQLGRGVDMAWALGELLDRRTLDERLSVYPGRIYRPTPGARHGALCLACPGPGSLESLLQRYRAFLSRFHGGNDGGTISLFSQPPKPRFVQVAYDCPPSRSLFELRVLGKVDKLGVCPLVEISPWLIQLRDLAATRLRKALPDRAEDVDRYFVGRRVDGLPAAPADARVRIIPLPSIGHGHVDRGVRRVLVEVPSGIPLRADDVFWALSGIDLGGGDSHPQLVLTPAEEQSMLGHYGVGDDGGYRKWRTVTPAALPDLAARRRIDPLRRTDEAKPGTERAAEHSRAAFAVGQALRHAKVAAGPQSVLAQREPFEARGARAEAFAKGTRFAKERLWHVEVTLERPIRGPLVIGDGRFLGLGIMAPIKEQAGVFAFAVVDGLAEGAEPEHIALALRRAVVARVQARRGRGVVLKRFISGHEPDGRPAQGPHLSFVYDAERRRALVLAPHELAKRNPTHNERRELDELAAALSGFRELRAGRAGLLRLMAIDVDRPSDPLFAPSPCWRSVTPYVVTRHQKGVGAAEAFAMNVRTECHDRGLPEPTVRAADIRGTSGVGLIGNAELCFEVAVPGPILLGKTRHRGGGLFARSSRVVAALEK